MTYIKTILKKWFGRAEKAAPEPAIIAPSAVLKADANRKAFDDNMTFWNSQRPKDKPAPMRERYAAKDGTIYYEYADISDLPVIRSQKLQEAMLKLEYAVTDKYMKEQLTPNIQKAIADKDKDLAMRIMADFVDRYNLAPEIPTMCDICALLLIRHDENPYSYNPIIHSQKQKHAQQDYDLQAFFLHASWLILLELKPQSLAFWKIGSEADFLSYLEGQTPIRKS